jgi:hypothetical protein
VRTILLRVLSCELLRRELLAFLASFEEFDDEALDLVERVVLRAHVRISHRRF